MALVLNLSWRRLAKFFGIPFMKINEYYLDGHGRLEIPIIGVTEGPKTNQGANLGFWADLLRGWI